MFAPRLRHACLFATAVALGPALPAQAGTVEALRVMLHPYAAPRGELPASAQAKLEEIAGTSLILTRTTRTGGLELALPAAVDEADAAAIVKKLRVDRSVLWAEPILPATPTARAKAAASDVQGRRLMVRIRDGVTPDWEGFLNRLSNKLGTKVTLERQIAHIAVLSVASDHSAELLAGIAARIQEEAEVQYADAVRWMRPAAAPNDPLFGAQWALRSGVAGINAETAWELQPSAAGVTVAVVDTGILPHPDMTGRVLPGYDFISDPGRARDGNARDPDPRDEGDWSHGDCFGAHYDSFFHGLFVAGIIAANSNNGVGVAGIAGNVNILPVRVLGACGGTTEDVLEGMLWASGVQIAGVPPNKTPAKVINLSLGGYGACDQAMQEAVDDALAQGAVIVAAAGNDGAYAADFAPANCSGVVTVGAHNAQAGLTSYSNFGRRVDLTAPGGDSPAPDLVVGLSNDGATTPNNPDYVWAAGTSFAAPMVAGTVAMLLARDAMLTGGRVLDRLAGAARAYPEGSNCVAGFCGAGMLDAGASVGSTIPGGVPPPNTTRVVEYYRADLDHYFITADPAEANFLDTFLAGTFQRTGLYFHAYLNPVVAPPDVQPVCRFYANADVQINSHYYSANFDECLAVLLNWPGVWELETATAFYIEVPDASGRCRTGTLPVYRFFNNRRDANHRYTVDLSVRRAMNNRTWVPEGTGPASVAFCSPV
jgi:serine protease